MTTHLSSPLSTDATAARRQVAALLTGSTADDVLTRAGGTPALRVTGGVAVAGNLLVAGPARDQAVRHLRRTGFTVTGRAGDVVRLTRPGLTAAEIDRLIIRLSGPDCRVAPDHLVVAAPVGKFAAAGPLPMSTATGAAAPARPLPVRAAVGKFAKAGPMPVRAAVSKFAKAGPLPTARRPAGSPGGGRGVTIAVVDTAAATGSLLTGADGHAGFVASIVRQLAPASDVRIVPALDADGVGTDFDVAAALFALLTDPPTLVNLSLSALADTPPIAMASALAALDDHGVLVVAAAGNDGSAQPAWPAATPSVVAVGSPAPYSNHGPWVDVVIPAEGVVAEFPRGVREGADGLVEHHRGYAAWTGTSFAAPQVTGLLAAALSAGATRADALLAVG